MEIIEKTVVDLRIALTEIDTIIRLKQKEIHTLKVTISQLQEENLESGTERKIIADKVEILTAINLVLDDVRTGVERFPGVKLANKILLDSGPAKLAQGIVMMLVEEVWGMAPQTMLDTLKRSGRFYKMVRDKLIERGWNLQTVPV